ncbi:sensor domain-containing diguanylate cyclase [Colwellia hornerae]|uniref:GGDEF domain-containing protein n=1 Tax=Colwellia hornerae TaxID=89402 RepID=A0A5C6Q3H3_9GAMM|nr:sensor domain-containing diguanylate cyclase [Colwellia hornerae]TWX47411.1 GGDEF domain-containing protein [Colwellia hornerae]TWX54691.1 GGDEF domain-containing protein [Colwellia hornerae]TWX63404.1 GGDEF domain-containing protein [Colwellia hornerae]
MADISIEKIIIESLALTKDGVGIFNRDDRLIYCNDAIGRLFGMSAEEALNKSFSELSADCFNSPRGINIEFTTLEAWLSHASAKRRSCPFRTFEVDTQEGKWFLVTEQIVHNDYLYMYITDITEKKANERALQLMSEQFQKLATIDSLTGIYNRRYFYEKANAEFNRSSRKNKIFSIMFFDLDNFKHINDKFGHAAGDAVLKCFAVNVQTHLRNYDTFARVGGEEFAILLPNTEKDNACVIAERIRASIEALMIPFEKESLKITVSVGVVENLIDIKSIDQIMNNADKRLYQAKSNGRNQVC